MIDTDELTVRGPLPVRHDYGGNRLAILQDGSGFAAAAFESYGVSFHRADTGERVWNRRDLKRCQTVAFLNGDQWLFCELEGRSSLLLDPTTGENLLVLPRIHAWFWCPFTSRSLQHRAGGYYWLLRESLAMLAKIPMTSFGLLDVAFSPSIVCVSEACQSVRAFESATGQLLWELPKRTGVHATQIVYSPKSNEFVAVMFPYETALDSRLTRIDPVTGAVIGAYEIPRTTSVGFASAGTRFVGSRGEVRAVIDGELIGTVPIPW